MWKNWLMNAARSAVPARTLVMLLALNLLAWLWVTRVICAVPVLPLQLKVDAGTVRVVGVNPGVAVPVGAEVLGLGRGTEAPITLLATDLIEEPDYFDTYPEMAAFFARQSQFAELLRAPTVVHWSTGEESGRALVTPAGRSPAELPLVYWFQLAYGSLSCLIGCWVWLLRPSEWGARMFAVTGSCFALLTLGPAIYSVRGLALQGDLFRLLSSLNHLGAILFGCGLVALMLSYPRLLLAPRWLVLPFVIFLPTFVLDALRLAPNQDWGMRIPIMSQMLLAIALGGWQWRRAREDALGRAALRWVLLSSLVGCGLFVFLMVGSTLLGSLPPIPQGYALGLFLVMYIGLALGVGRYRLFDLDRWAYRVLIWVAGAFLVLLLDSVLIAGLHLAPDSALAVALLASGWMYFPLRQWLLVRLLGARRPLEDALGEIVALALLPESAARAHRWEALLQQVFAPANIVPLPDPGPPTAALLDEGLALAVPAHADSRALRLNLRDSGRGLFGPEDVRFTDNLLSLLRQTQLQQAGLRAAAQAERQRLAQDLHDDLGSRLLMLIHRTRDRELTGIAREAMADLRSILSAIDGPGASLADVLANGRAEASARCEAAGRKLDWQVSEELPLHWLSSHTRSVLERCLRELLTNALKHGAGDPVAIDARVDSAGLRLAVTNPLPGAEAEWPLGRGLRGLARRLAALGGQLNIDRQHPSQARVELVLPL
jgi:signal transduction histidine kinase